MIRNQILSELMDIDVSTLATKQKQALISHTIDVLNRVIDYIQGGNWEDVRSMLSYSPAGDDMGCDNNFIDFSWTKRRHPSEGHMIDSPLDLGDVIDTLQDLEKKEKTVRSAGKVGIGKVLNCGDEE